MKTYHAKEELSRLLSFADIEINGNDPWDIIVHNENFYNRVLSQGSQGLGESYMEKWWDSHAPDIFFYRIINADLESRIKKNLKLLTGILISRIINRQQKSRAFNIALKHYNLGNDLFTYMLGQSMAYTCGYWKNADSLDQAQYDKLDLCCRKLHLVPGQHILDIGCGWGSFGRFAAEKYGVKVTGITVSAEQVNLGKKLCGGLPVEIRLQDYRDLTGTYDHVVSLGMFEHVGYKNYRTFMNTVHRCLSQDGLFLLHTIGSNTTGVFTDPWIHKYIFPDSMLPSVKQMAGAIEGIFIMEDWHNFSADYDKTLMAWYANFNRNREQIKNNSDEMFYRMWKYYLLMCAGSFRARKNQVWQIVLSKKGVPGGYQSVR